MFRCILSALFALTVSLAASAQPDLKGKTLAETFAELLPKLEKDNAAQQRWQDICFALGAPGQEKLRVEACGLMAAKLDATTPTPARLWLLAQLQRIGSEESVESVAALLNDPDHELREAAVRVLANNASPQATVKLTERLAKITGPSLDMGGTKFKVGLLNALGHRGDRAAVSIIAKNLGDNGIAEIAAAQALGRIPGPEAAKTLEAARTAAKGAVRGAIGDAMLVHADRFLKAGKTAEAAAIYEVLYGKDEPRSVRLAALRGKIQTAGEKAGDLVLTILGEDDRGARAVAIGQIASLSTGALKTLAANLEKLPVPSRVAVITAIAARGDRALLGIALAAAKSTDVEVKRAGIVALGRLGDASVTEFLLDAMSAKDATAGIAADSLAALPAEGVNEKLIAVLEAEKNSTRLVALIGILERRKATAAVLLMLKAAVGGDLAVRTAAFAGLKTLAAPEHLPGMIAALVKTTKGKERDAAELAIATVALQIPQPEKRAEPLLAAIKAGGPSQSAEFLPLLGRLGGAEALKLIREAIAGTDATLREAAIVGICNWPDASANEDLVAIAEKGNTDVEKLKALKALIRVITVLIERTPEERIAALDVMKKAMELATRDEERRAILEGLGNVRLIETLRYVIPYLDQPALAQAACKGVVELAHSKMLREPNKAEFIKALDRVIAMSKDNALIERAKGYKTAQ